MTRKRAHHDDALTPRELEAARLLAQGLMIKQVADRMGISFHTASRHADQVRLKFGVHNRAMCILEAQRRGIV
ncbi:MAG: hypothetical protein RLZZ373_2628 [Pseudomonadota bacterium]|jgi:DNA-binding NarL/FixJ family response regulator